MTTEVEGLGAGTSDIYCASAGEPFREAVELGLNRGRNAMINWQDLVPTVASAAANSEPCEWIALLMSWSGDEPDEVDGASQRWSTQWGDEAPKC